MRRRNRWLASTVGMLALLGPAATSVRAQGGPPLITDDPDTPGPGYWEINVSVFHEEREHGDILEAPRVDLNYGVGKTIQLKLEMPWLIAAEDGQPTVHGPGNVVAGVKWRFLGQEGERWAWSVYPQVEFNTDHDLASLGIVDEGHVFVLPSEITLELGRIEINGELGWTFVEGGEHDEFWGVASEVTVHRRLELLAELHGEHRGEEQNEVIVNGGARWKLTDSTILMMAVGRAESGATEDRPSVLLYGGVQFNLPGLYHFEKRHKRGA